MSYPVIDLHCDLLGCVEYNQKLNFFSPQTNCSLPQLKSGGVALQTFAIAALTGRRSAAIGMRQLQLYQELLRSHSHIISSFRQMNDRFLKERIYGILAIENASAICEEDESLELGFQRIAGMEQLEKVLYISLTWNGENRFGGGNASSVGLKEDGKRLLEFLSGRQIAIDLSHTSDPLANDIFNHMEKKSLQITPIASHSNYRQIKNLPRNLPNEIAREIINRRGLIGMNFVRRFVGDQPENFISHIRHGISLGGKEVICFGADFYGGLDDLLQSMKERSFPIFQREFANSSCYPSMFSMLKNEYQPEFLQRIAYRNVSDFLQRQGLSTVAFEPS
jgi:microsomal dipeptidase-like Zn-dependent dipeptidase